MLTEVLGGVGIALMGVALGAYQWLNFKWWSKRHQQMYFYRESRWWWLPGSLRLPIPDQLSPKRRTWGFLFGEAMSAVIVLLGAAMVVAAVA